MIEREGIGRVTHRNITRVAGLPATSAAYHFDTINDLLEAALLWADEQTRHALASVAASDDPVLALTTWLVEDFRDNRARCLAEYELFLYAARTPSLRPSARHWMTDLAELVSQWTDDPALASTICAYVDGVVLHALVTNDAPDPVAFANTIRAMVAA